MNGDDSDWNQLVVDDAATATPLDEPQYRQWLRGQRVFVSSTMDGELTPYRDAVRGYLGAYGGPQTAVMWETVTPADQDPRGAYLGGVDQSTLFVLMLGESYGVDDASGFSPTHQEANRAEERGLARLLFTLDSPRRDGPLQRWLASLYSKVAGNRVESAEGLVKRLDAMLRELAARAQRSWIKLGPFMFPGKVSLTAGPQSGTRYVVTARVASNRVRRGLLELGNRMKHGEMRLTWPDHSFPVRVEEVASESELVGEDAVTVTCRGVDTRGGGMQGVMIGGSMGGGVGPVEQAELWCRRAILGEAYQDAGIGDLLGMLSRPEGPTLPAVLSGTGASGWLAEGLVRLYAVEGLARKWHGAFERLEVGPATGRAVPIRGKFGLHDQFGSASETGGIAGNIMPAEKG